MTKKVSVSINWLTPTLFRTTSLKSHTDHT